MSFSLQQDSYQIRLLGPIQIERNGAPIGRLESRKALALLCYLCCQNKAVSRNQLTELFWADKSETRGRGNLSRVLHSIGQEMPDVFLADRHSIRLNPATQLWVDVLNFESLMAERKPHLAAAATELYRGEFLEDLGLKECPEFDVWLTGRREQWQQRVAQSFQSLITHHIERGEYDRGLRAATRLLALLPWDEDAHRQKILLHYLRGERTAALAQFDRCRQILADELGVEPSRETKQLRSQIEMIDGIPIGGFSMPQLTPVEPLYERNEAHTWLVRSFEEARRAQGKFTLVEGEAGVGKTALLDEIMAYAAGRGARVLRSRCYEYRSGLSFGAFVNALRPLFGVQHNLLATAAIDDIWLLELAQLWPEVKGVQPLPISPKEETNARHRLFEAVAQALTAAIKQAHSAVLFFDDLHEADQPTLDLLRYLYHRLKGYPIWFVCAYRREETTPNHPLSLFRNVLVREGELAATELAVIGQESVIQILRQYEGLSTPQVRRLAQFLQEESEGNPFILSEIRRAMEDKQVLSEKDGIWQMDSVAFDEHFCQEVTIPVAVGAVFETKLARLNPRARRLLQIAAGLGREFQHKQLLAASGEPEEWIEVCLSSWIARRLVIEVEMDAARQHTYRFSHVMLWRAVLHELTPMQRERLDLRINEMQQVDGQATTAGRATINRIEELTE
ncbi:AAA family ATPase [bacterium]|nr:AAA family ATPase [bacterium]